MKKARNIRELIDISYNRYKSKNAITIKRRYEKCINFFNYKFDIYSLARALKSKENKIKNKKVAILSENRYEFLVTYLANIIAKNTVIIIDNSLSKAEIEKIIRKQNINTIFFSDSNKEKIIQIFKLNETNKCNKDRIINLINFDPENKFPIIEYEKLINIGRYIENYSVASEIEAKKIIEENKNTIIINKKGSKIYCEKDFLQSAYIIGKNIKLKKCRKTIYIDEINNFYQIVIGIILPIMYGLNIIYGDVDHINSKIENLQLERNSKKENIILYRNNKYKVQNINSETNILKINDKLLKQNIKIEEPRFVLIKSDNNIKAKHKKSIINI